MALQLKETAVTLFKYNTALMEFKIRQNVSQKDLMTKQWVDIMIQRVQAAELVVNNDGYIALHESVKETLRTYLVDIKDGKKSLILKPIPGKEHRSKTIIPFEETYDIVKKAHIETKHGKPKDMDVWFLSNKFVLNDMCAQIYCQLCKLCQTPPIEPTQVDKDNVTSKNETNNKQIVESEASDQQLKLPQEKILKSIDTSEVDSFKHVCSVDVLDISQNPDNNYHYLIIYEDRKTNFIQLRPLNTNTEAEIAMELIKILMDLGPPECIEVDIDNIKLFKGILNRVKVLANNDIALEIHRYQNKLINKVAKNIIRWMEEQDCKNWGTGCHVVQWNMNNELDIDGNTPFSRVFGYKYMGFGYKSKFVRKYNPRTYESDDEFDDEETEELSSDYSTNQIVNEAASEESSQETFLVTVSENVVKSEMEEDPLF